MKTNPNKKPPRNGGRRTRRPTICFKRVRIDQLRLNGGTQTRAALDLEAVEEYAATMAGESTCTMPPIIVYEDTAHIRWLADGFHRVGAAQKNGQMEIAAEVRLGTRLDALLYSLGANQMHGVRRTNADTRCSVEVALAEKTLCGRSSREIAELCGVGHQLVDTIRREQGQNKTVQVDESSTSVAAAKRVGGDGKMYPAEGPKSAKKSAPNSSIPPPPEEQARSDDAGRGQIDGNETQKKKEITVDTRSFVTSGKKSDEDNHIGTSNKTTAPLKTVVADTLEDAPVAPKTNDEATTFQALGTSTPPQVYSDADSRVEAETEEPKEENPYWNEGSPGWEDIHQWLSKAHDKLPMDRYTEAERRAFDECFTETARCTVGLGEDICPNYQVKAHIAIHATAALGIILGESLRVSE